MDRLRYNVYKRVSILTKQSKNVFKVGTVQTMISEFNYNYKSDEFYHSDEGTKASSENNTFNKENSVNKASEYHDFIKEHQAGTTKGKETNLTLKYE